MAELTVRVEGGADGVQVTYKYQFRPLGAEGTGPLDQEYAVTPSPDLVRLSCENIDKIIMAAFAGTTGQHSEKKLVDAGQLLYRALFPATTAGVPGLVQRLRDSAEPLLIRTSEALVPWELLHDGTDFLALNHDIARGTLVNRAVVDGRAIGRVRRALVVGDPTGDLAAAGAEAEEIVSWLEQRGVDCTPLIGSEATLLRVLDELTSGGYDLLHYCGHVTAPLGTKYVGLLLHDKELLDERALESLATTGVPPVVFVNGCESAGQLTNLCVSFMVMGAKIVVGTRYSVREEPARQFAERFYLDLISGSTAGAAVSSARRSVRHDSALDWTAFVLYGDPLIQVMVGENQQPSAGDSTVVVSPSLDAYRFDESAQVLMRKMTRMAAPLGIATSMDLLGELLGTDAMRSKAADTVGVERIELVDELLRTLRENMPVVTADPDTQVELSGTVSSVLARAERAAQETGRELITTADLVSAFVAVGGGSSGPILEIFGLSLSELAGNSHVGQQPWIASKNGVRTCDELVYDESGRLREELLTPGVASAVRVAAMLATANETAISTAMLLYGFAVAGDGILRERLLAQGDTGRTALAQLSMAGTRRSRLSARIRRVLHELVAAGRTQPIDESAILRELLSDRASSARLLMSKLGVNVGALLSEQPSLDDATPQSEPS